MPFTVHLGFFFQNIRRIVRFERIVLGRYVLEPSFETMYFLFLCFFTKVLFMIN